MGVRSGSVESMVAAEEWIGRRVLITGHTGFKGTWLAIWLKYLGARVYGYSKGPIDSPSLYEITSPKLDGEYFADINDLDELKGIIKSFEIEVIFHLAAQAIVQESYISPLDTYRTNLMGTVTLLEALRQTESVRAAVMITTDKCYENREWEWSYRENDRLGGFDPYSNSKACCELAIESYRKSFFGDASASGKKNGPSVASARAGNVIGGGDFAKFRLIPDYLRARSNNEKMLVRAPNAVRPWQHVLEPLSGYLILGQKLVLKVL